MTELWVSTVNPHRRQEPAPLADSFTGQPHQNVDYACSPTTGSGVSDSITPTSTNAATKLLQKIDDLV